jgi:hypothetical protein
MTQLLEKAIQRAQELPLAEQDVVASLILEEIESERGWQERFGSSQDLLAKLAQEALDDLQAGRTRPMPDEL